MRNSVQEGTKVVELVLVAVCGKRRTIVRGSNKFLRSVQNETVLISCYGMFASEGDEVVPERINIQSETESRYSSEWHNNHISLLKRGQPGCSAGFQTRQNRSLASSDATVLGALFFVFADADFLPRRRRSNQRPVSRRWNPGNLTSFILPSIHPLLRSDFLSKRFLPQTSERQRPQHPIPKRISTLFISYSS